MRLGEPLVDLLDDAHLEHLAVGRLRELVRAVRRADRDRERVDPGRRDELDRLVGIGEVHLARAVPVLDPAERAELALDGDATRVRVLDDLLRDGDVVVERGRRLAVGLERAVHHHAREAELDRGDARRGLVAVVEVERDRDLRVELDRRLHQVPEEPVVRVGARAAGGLDDDRRARSRGPPP